MDITIVVALIAGASGLISGTALALVTTLSNRKKTAAEIRKLDAERSKSAAEADSIRLAMRTALMELDAKATPMDSGTARELRATPPPGWLLRGSEPDSYEVGTESSAQPGRPIAYLRAKPQPKGFGTLMQMFTAGDYRGSRQMLSARIRAENVTAWAGLWMRVDGPGDDTLTFDNMESRPIRGTTDWTSYRVILDVPEEATHIALGVLLRGPGSLWIDNVRLEEVDEDVPSTDIQRDYPSAPMNLDFSE